MPRRTLDDGQSLLVGCLPGHDHKEFLCPLPTVRLISEPGN
jgi:hypothetical protein